MRTVPPGISGALTGTTFPPVTARMRSLLIGPVCNRGRPLLAGFVSADAVAQVAYAFPAGGGGEVAAVHQHLDARQVIRAELGVLAVVGLHDRGVGALTQVVGLQSVGGQLVVGEQR